MMLASMTAMVVDIMITIHEAGHRAGRLAVAC
jgi:hypothetical protein